jgi:hypothetical protein
MIRRILTSVGATVAVTGLVLLSTASPAAAHNCGSLFDCLPSGRSLLIALAAVLIVVGLVLIIAAFPPAGAGLALAGGGVVGSAGAISMSTVVTGAVSVGTGIALATAAEGMPTGGGGSGGSGSGGSRPSSERLAQNLEEAGHVRPPDTAAHHLVAGERRLAGPAREVLRRFGININAAENGVFLPRNVGAANPQGHAVHSTLHTNRYYTEVNRLLGQATNRQEAIDVLNFIRSRLLAGPWP